MKNTLVFLLVFVLSSGMPFVAQQEMMKLELPAKAMYKVVNTKMLWDFEDEAELKDFAVKQQQSTATINDDPKFVKSGKKSLQIEVGADDPYPGIFSGVHEETKTAVKSDWSGDFNCIRFDIYNTLSETAKLSCRIDDTKSENYKTRYNNDEITLKPGWNTVKISFDYLRHGEGKSKSGKKIDLKNIRLFSLFSNMKRDVLFYVDNIRLDKLVEADESGK